MEEDLRKNWRDARFRADSGDDIQTVIDNRRQPALQRLAARYNRFSNLALICILWCPFFALSHVIEVSDQRLRLALSIYAGIYFLICSVMDRWLCHGIRGIDCATMPVSEVLRLTLFYRKRHLQFMMVLIPMAVVFVGGMAWLGGADEPYFLWGIVTGVLLGLAVASRQFLLFMSDYKDITR